MKAQIGIAVLVAAVCFGCDDQGMREEGGSEIGAFESESGGDTGTDTGDPIAEQWPGWCCEVNGGATDYECCSLVPLNGKCSPGEVLVYSRDHPGMDDGVCE